MSASMPSPLPPPPPPPLPPALKQLSPLPPPPPLPPNAFDLVSMSSASYQDAMARKKMLESAEAKKPFSPCFFFFYGSLMDPEVLQAVLGLSEPPIVEKASIAGFSMKMWGIYPTLIRSTKGEKISGTAWKVEKEAYFLRLSEYETEAYTWCACDIELDNGDILQDCRTFCWAGDPDSKDLEEGTFDLQRYQRYFKPSVVRKGAGHDEAYTQATIN